MLSSGIVVHSARFGVSHSLACHEVKGGVDGKVADEAETVDGTLLINGHLQAQE